MPKTPLSTSKRRSAIPKEIIDKFDSLGVILVFFQYSSIFRATKS
ncbi:MAG: hypothetical protein ACTSPH_02115 [Promethearchaeota archaeon]